VVCCIALAFVGKKGCHPFVAAFGSDKPYFQEFDLSSLGDSP
jgi:hypothetical protein